MNVLAETIIKERRRKGWSQSELARRSRIHQQNLSRWERGEQLPNRTNLRKLANTFQQDPERWFKLKTKAEVSFGLQDEGLSALTGEVESIEQGVAQVRSRGSRARRPPA